MDKVAELSTGVKLMVVAGVLLLIDTFFAWQKVTVNLGVLGSASAKANAWHGFWGVVLGLLLIALLAVIAVKVSGIELGLQLPYGTLTTALGGAILVFAVLKNLIDDYSAWASYVGIVLAAIVAAGAWMTMQGPAVVAGSSAPPAPEPPAPPAPPAPSYEPPAAAPEAAESADESAMPDEPSSEHDH